MRRLILIIGLFLVAGMHQGLAGTDEGLYDPVAPEGSAFVRFVNIGSGVASVSVNNKKYDSISAYSATPYYVVPKGKVKILFGGQKIKENILAGNYYTVSKTRVVFITKDIENKNRAKATLAF